MQNYTYFIQINQECQNQNTQFTYASTFINISCICKNNTVSHSKFGQQWLGLTLRVNTWLWNSANLFLDQHVIVSPNMWVPQYTMLDRFFLNDRLSV